MKSAKLAAVILHYNDWENTEAQIRRILPYAALSYVVVVDNCSTDGSGEKLEDLQREVSESSGKLRLLHAARNGGYGAGNNLGIRYALDLGADYVLVANPDTRFSEACLAALLRCFAKDKRIGAASVLMRDRQHGLQQTAWPIRPWLSELVNSCPVLRRLLSRLINYRPSYLQGRSMVAVGTLHGSLLMLSGEAFRKSGGYDEGIFLYYEEHVLAQRLRRVGYRSVLLPRHSYFHENSGSISKSFRGMTARQKLRQQSERYYYRHYLHIAPWQEALTKAVQGIVLAETALAERVLAAR